MAKSSDRRITLRGVFANNKFVFVFSLLISFCLWLWISIEKSPVVENTILSVPVEISLEDSIPSQLGLKVFGNENYTVDVTVVGKKFVVGSLTADDIRVAAQTSYVDSAGTKTLLLKASPLNNKDFEITALSQNYISVYFDSLKETEFAVVPKVISNVDKVVDDGLILGDAVLSNSTLRVSGPATEVNKITGITAEYVIDETLSKTTTVTPELKFEGANTDDLKNTEIVDNTTVTTMTIPILKKVVLPTTVSFRNVPADYLDYSFKKTVSPASVTAEIQVEKLEQTKEIVVGTIDFNKLDLGTNEFKFNSGDITDYVLLNDNIQFNCSVVIDDVVAKTITVPTKNIKIENVAEGYSVKVLDSKIDNVKILGPQADIDKLNSGDVSVSLDLANITLAEGNMSVPVSFSVNYSTSSWASGEYKVRISCVKN